MSNHHLPECRTTIFTGRPAVFASRVAKPECRTTIFTGRPAAFASRVAKPECRTTIFTGRPAAFASRVAKPECRTTIFTGRPDRLLFYYFTVLPFHLHSVPGRGFLHVGPPILHVRRTPAFSRGFFASRKAFFACRLTFLHVGQTYP